MQKVRISLAGGARFFHISGLARVEQDDRVHVAVAGVEDVADGEAGALRHPADKAQRGGDLGARHDAILHIIRGADSSHGAKRVFAAFPEKVALLGGAGHAELAGAGPGAGFAHQLHLLLDRFAESLQLD